MPVTALNERTIQIGFIGLGLMGSRLTRRLHLASWNVQAWNRSPEPADVLRQEGVMIAASVAKLVADSDVVLASNVSANGDLDLAAITPFVIGQRASR